MKTIDQVELKVKPYSDVFERAVDEMLKVYSYAPYDIDVARGGKYVADEGAILLKQAAILESGQSTEVRELQSKTMDVSEARSRYNLAEYIREMTGARVIIATGDKIQIDLKAQAHRRNDGCTIHTSFDVKYGGAGRMVHREWTNGFCREEDIESDLHLFMYQPFDTLQEQTGITDLENNAIEFVKKLRDNDLTPGINLSSLSDEEIENATFGRANPHANIVDFLIERTGLSTVDFLEKWLSVIDPVAKFDLSQLSFHFEYDIELDEETFRSYFMIEGDGEYEAKAAEQARLDQIKANVPVVKPKVLEKLEEVLDNYDIEDYDLDIETLAEEIAECRDRVETFNEELDGDEADELFFSLVDEFAKSSEYVVHFSDDGYCGYSLTGDRKDGHTYSFETAKYLYTGGYGETFIYVGGDLYDLSGSAGHFADKFTVEDAFELLASRAHCSVLELPHRLVDQGYKDFDDETLLSASDESEIYAWLEDNSSAYDIVDILEENDLIEKVVGEYDKTLHSFEIDFSDCFED